jgi:hypothetical protein
MPARRTVNLPDGRTVQIDVLGYTGVVCDAWMTVFDKHGDVIRDDLFPVARSEIREIGEDATLVKAARVFAGPKR